jgi:hypothetical protein
MPTRDQWAILAAGLFLLANIIVPAVIGDLYPFTSGPMFRDAPTKYCNYRVYDPAGRLIDAETFLTHRIYDGNPVGYGVGIKPPRVLEEFGRDRDEAYCRQHVLEHLAADANRKYSYVIIEQDVIGPIDSERVGVVRTNRWQIDNPHIRTKD